MKLSTRLTLVLVILTAALSLSTGWFAVTTSTDARYRAVDTELNAIATSGHGHPLTALSAALYQVQTNSYDVTMDVVAPSGEVTQVDTGDTPLTVSPTRTDAEGSLRRVRTTSDLAGFRYRSVDVGGGDLLVVAASTSAIAETNRQIEVRVALLGLAAALLMVLLVRLLTRRDLRAMQQLIRFATLTAEGANPPAPEDVGATTDIQELRAALLTMVDSLQYAIDVEKRSSREMQQFIGDASHELRTPLTVIRGYSELLERPALDEEQRARALSRVRTEVSRMESLVEDLLFLAEVNEWSGHGVEQVNLSDLVTGLVSDFVQDHPERPCTSNVDEGITMSGRPDFLERLLLNALRNVDRHTPTDAPVSVTLQSTTAEVTLTIDDGGPGLPAEATVLRSFQRFDASRSRATGGSGLGMSIMADVTASHGGSMSTSTSPLGGLRLSFVFPRVEDQRPLG